MREICFTSLSIARTAVKLATYADARDPDSIAIRRRDRSVFLEFADVAPFVPAGSVVFDLGAHSGVASTYYLALGHPVVSFEPATENLRLLRAAQTANAFPDWALEPAAVSNAPGTLTFTADGPHGHITEGDASGTKTETVPAISLDTWLAGHPQSQPIGMLKIDVEGAEVKVLHGGRTLLSTPGAPALFIESNGHCLAWFGETPATLRRVIADYGYTIFAVRSKRPLRPTAFYPVDPDGLQARTVVNYFCIKDVAAFRRMGARIERRLPSTADVVRDIAITLRGNDDERRYLRDALPAFPAIAELESVRALLARDAAKR